jgi:hypothetical protein
MMDRFYAEYKFSESLKFFFIIKWMWVYDPTDGVSALSWWRGLSYPETLRAMPAVA